jgi:benzaldehyde dehydrogenase (NAD)
MTTLHTPLQLHINGADVPASDNKTFEVVNPLTGVTIFPCASAGVKDYETAIQSAHTAFQSWSTTPPSTRRTIFLQAADILTGYLDGDAPDILSNEVSAVPSWVRLNIMAAAGVLRESAGLATHIKGEIIPADRPGTTIMVLREAIGVMFAISPWNAPVSVQPSELSSF